MVPHEARRDDKPAPRRGNPHVGTALSPPVAVSRRLRLSERIAEELRRREGRNLVGVGVFGSVARGTDREFSDIDLLVVVRRKRRSFRHRMREGILVTVLQMTPAEARREVTGRGPWLGEALAGWRSMRALYDPTRLIARLKARARRPTARQFRESARRALLEAYEDYGKLRNAIAAGDREEAREMALWFAGGAMGFVLDVEGRVPETGRRAFIQVRRRGALGRAIVALRYRPLPLKETKRVAERTWAAMVRRARAEGIAVPGLTDVTGSSARPGPSRGR